MKDWTREQITNLFEEKLSGIVYFYTPMCGTCQVAGKMINVIEATLANIKITKANLNFLPEIATDLSIESVPCLLFISNGVVKEKIYAFQSVPFLYDKIKTFCH
jgi:thioredoxin 1